MCSIRRYSVASTPVPRFKLRALLITVTLSLLVSLSLGCRSTGRTSRSDLQDPEKLFNLTILHTNDTHARYLEINRFGSSCAAEDAQAGKCFGGAARRKTMIDRFREEKPNVVLLDAGDQFQGTLFYSRFKGDTARQIMNHLKYDAMVTGNHEFDDGPAVLSRFIGDLDFPVVVSNLSVAREPSLVGRIVTTAVLERGEQKIGLVGFITEETPGLSSPGPTLDFLPAEEELRKAVATLEAQGINKIIALSHAGFDRDKLVAATVSGIDVIVGGHTNTLLSNSGQGQSGPYPVVITGPGGDPVLVVTAFAYGKYLGALDVGFDQQGTSVSWQGDAILLDAQVQPDKETEALLRPLAEEIRQFAAEPIGVSEVNLIGNENVCRAEECNLGNLIADALLEEHQEKGIEIALQNGGGVRTSLKAGTITIGDLLEVLPFGNTASTFGLKGSDLLATLEHGVSRAEDLNNDGTGRFLQVAGLRYTWSADRPQGARILKAEVGKGTEWSPIDSERVYRVVMNGFNRNGGDGFVILRDRAIDAYDQGRVVADIVVDYLRRHSPVRPATDGRITRAQ